MIDVSIIIINYNTFNLTVKCIESIYRYTKNIRIEIILVDNASTERNPDGFLLDYPELILIKNNENVGFARGNNIGIQRSSAKIILLLNSDTEILDNSICQAYNLLCKEQIRNVGVITGKLLFPDGKLQYQCGKFPSIGLELYELLRLQKILPKKFSNELLLGAFFDHESAIYPDWIWGTFFMFKKEILTCFTDHKLSENFFMYAEDLEWCYKIRRCGYQIYYEPSIKALHHFSASFKDIASKKKRDKMIEENYSSFIKKYKGRLYYLGFRFIRKINSTVQEIIH